MKSKVRIYSLYVERDPLTEEMPGDLFVWHCTCYWRTSFWICKSLVIFKDEAELIPTRRRTLDQ